VKACEAIEHLKGYDPEEGLCVLIWTRADIRGRAQRMNMNLTDDQLDLLLYRLEHKHDASLGVSWDTIDAFLEHDLEPGVDGKHYNGVPVKPLKTEKDYGYCEECETFFDLWKYGDIESAGHADHKWRHVTAEELKKCVQDCVEDGCFEEE
jgi:hypothetical protein